MLSRTTPTRTRTGLFPRSSIEMTSVVEIRKPILLCGGSLRFGVSKLAIRIRTRTRPFPAPTNLCLDVRWSEICAWIRGDVVAVGTNCWIRVMLASLSCGGLSPFFRGCLRLVLNCFLHVVASELRQVIWLLRKPIFLSGGSLRTVGVSKLAIRIRTRARAFPVPTNLCVLALIHQFTLLLNRKQTPNLPFVLRRCLSAQRQFSPQEYSEDTVHEERVEIPFAQISSVTTKNIRRGCNCVIVESNFSLFQKRKRNMCSCFSNNAKRRRFCRSQYTTHIYPTQRLFSSFPRSFSFAQTALTGAS